MCRAESAGVMDRSAQGKDKEGALAAHRILETSCMACHQQHRGGPGGPPGGFGPMGGKGGIRKGPAGGEN